MNTHAVVVDCVLLYCTINSHAYRFLVKSLHVLPCAASCAWLGTFGVICSGNQVTLKVSFKGFQYGCQCITVSGVLNARKNTVWSIGEEDEQQKKPRGLEALPDLLPDETNIVYGYWQCS